MKKILSIGAAALALATSVAQAEPLSLSGLDESQWRYDLTLYAFLPARTRGTSTIAGGSVDLDLTLKDAVDLLDFAMAGRGEAWRDNWGIILDANYVRLKTDGQFTLPPGAAVGVRADIRQKWLGLLGAYRVANATYGAQNRRYAVDLQAGVRWNALEQAVTVSAPVGGGTLGGDEAWAEPVIGARGVWELSDTWAASVAFDAGGFGAGGNDLQLGLSAGFDWRPWQNTSLMFGWRYYSIDYKTTRADGPFAYDVSQHGPYFGVTFRFQ